MRYVSLYLLILSSSILLTGCLDKAKTKVATLSGFTVMAPTLDTSSPPDFDGADDRGYVRFKGTCISIVDSFQVQVVHENGTLDWTPVPNAALPDTRSSPVMSSYPLNTGDYDASCIGDGSYDFWIYITQLETMLGVASGALPEIYSINIRGIFGTTPTAVLTMPTKDDESLPEANDFTLHVGHMPVGTGLCQPMGVQLGFAATAGGPVDHRAKSSSNKSFTVDLDAALILGSNIEFYPSQDCTGTAFTSKTAMNFTLMAGQTHKAFSFKFLSTVSSDKVVGASTSSFGGTLTRQKTIKSSTPGLAQHLLVARHNPELKMEESDCEEFDIYAVDGANTVTNDFTASTYTVSLGLTDISKFEFRTSCSGGSSNLGGAMSVTFTDGVDHKKRIAVRAKTGTQFTDAARVDFSQGGSEFISLPTVYINPPKLVHHLKMERVDLLSTLFNHECYPIKVSLRDSSDVAQGPAGVTVEFRLETTDQIQIYINHACTTPWNLTNPIAFSSSENEKTFFWSRRQLSPLTAPLGEISNARINFKQDFYSPYISNPELNADYYAGLQLKRSPLDLLGRGRQEIWHWYTGHMGAPTNTNMPEPLANPVYNVTGSALEAGLAVPYMEWVNTTADQAGPSGRFLRRQLFDFNANATTNGVSVFATNASNTDSAGSYTTIGSAFIAGGYFYVTDISSATGQQLISGVTTTSAGLYTLYLYNDGMLKLRHSALGASCQTAPAAIAQNRWTSIFLKLENNGSATPKCTIYVNGGVAATAYTQEAILQTEARFGASSLSERFKGNILEFIVDFDPTGMGSSRYSDSVMSLLHNDYFEQRYVLQP